MNAVQLLIDPTYNDHIHAIRCALNVSATAMGHSTSKWQQECVSGYRVSSIGSEMSKMERFQQDCLTRHMLRRQLSLEQWSVLYVRFAPRLIDNERSKSDASEFREMSDAVNECMGLLDGIADENFTEECLMRWSSRILVEKGSRDRWAEKMGVTARTVNTRKAEIAASTPANQKRSARTRIKFRFRHLERER